MANLLTLLSTLSLFAIQSIALDLNHITFQEVDASNTINHHGEENEPFVVNINYRDHDQFTINGTGRVGYRSVTTSLAILNFTDYATTMDEFENKYPRVTIEMSGQVVSGNTDDDVLRDYFQPLTYDTGIFIYNETKYETLIYTMGSGHEYSTYMKMFLGFQKQGSELFLWPFIDVSLTSKGPAKKILNYEFSIAKLTFKTTYWATEISKYNYTQV